MSTIEAVMPVSQLHGRTMGTSWAVRAVLPVDMALEPVQAGVQACLDRIDGSMSTYKPESELSRFNRAQAGTWHVLSPACFEVITHAFALARETGGIYDPTVGPAVNLWGFGPDATRQEPVAEHAVLAARERIGWQRIELDQATLAMRQPGGAYVDLSSIAKGYAVDVVGDWLRAHGVTSWLVEVGGEMKAHGCKPDGSAWRVGIEMPDAQGRYFCSLALNAMAIATSGDYRRRFASAGEVYSHHIDPRTGRPVSQAVASVSVLASRALHADPLGTAMTLLGPERGLAFAQARDIAVLFVLRTPDGLEPRLTTAFAAALQA